LRKEGDPGLHECQRGKPVLLPGTPRRSAGDELKIYRVRNPDFYDKAVVAYSEKDAAAALGTTDIEVVVDRKLLKKNEAAAGCDLPQTGWAEPALGGVGLGRTGRV
jgi:hypothetical protein